ncbi:SDR family NAD(P)-dependent oxidoreductase [Kingella negevensis]|uniref:SDR family NAD(P)-dependent oxidoreductase n=1 Tax=Kingella negevensis TaxID=1522312 RepID=UPI002542772B|nr:SDR family NAD(P)-dependent oxidoreductase [Kingella negevensis]WII92303.1 SDR family NAD(P)-dependent oxidoreductase [Kingella negevensis]
MAYIIITRHSRGLGKALVQHYLAHGHHVLGVSRKPLDLAHDNLQQIALDLSDTQAVLAALSQPIWQTFFQAADELVLINNAGTVAPNAVLGQQSAADIARAVALNVAAPMILSNFVAQQKLPKCSLKIVHISSGAGRRPFAGWNVYGATKAALDQHALCMADEAHGNILVGSVAPGVVDTDMQAEIRGAAAQDFPMLGRFVALKQDNVLTQPENVAEKIVRWVESAEFGGKILVDVREMQPENI